jgi:hypothetical protein
MVAFALFGQRNFAIRGFLRFLGKSVRQNNQPSGIPKSQQPERIAAKLGAHFPQIIRALQFLQILDRHARQFLHRLQYPQYFLRLLRVQRSANPRTLPPDMPRQRSGKIGLPTSAQVNLIVNLCQIMLLAVRDASNQMES